MITRQVEVARRLVDHTSFRGRGEFWRCPNVIDAQTVIFLPRSGTIIPPGKLLNLAVEPPENVFETPLPYVLDRRPFGL